MTAGGPRDSGARGCFSRYFGRCTGCDHNEYVSHSARISSGAALTRRQPLLRWSPNEALHLAKELWWLAAARNLYVPLQVNFGVDMTGLVSSASSIEGHGRVLIVVACECGTTWARGSIDG